MPTAEDLVQQIKHGLRQTEERILDHSYPQALEAKRFHREKLKLFAGEQSHIIPSDLRSIALLLSRHAHLPSRDYLLGAIEAEKAALANLPALAAACGFAEGELDAYEPMPGCQAYPAYVAWLGAHGSDGDFAAAFLVNLAAWGAVCGRISRALRDHYGFSPEATAFLDAFAAPAPEFEEGSMRVIQHGLDRGLDPRNMSRAARLIQAYELMFWDTLDSASRD